MELLTRGTFYTDGQELNITNVGTFTDGYAVTKYINVNADGSAAQRNDIPDIFSNVQVDGCLFNVC
jgi:hypothetical protein